MHSSTKKLVFTYSPFCVQTRIVSGSAPPEGEDQEGVYRQD
jgi:hypothetical protein